MWKNPQKNPKKPGDFLAASHACRGLQGFLESANLLARPCGHRCREPNLGFARVRPSGRPSSGLWPRGPARSACGLGLLASSVSHHRHPDNDGARYIHSLQLHLHSNGLLHLPPPTSWWCNSSVGTDSDTLTYRLIPRRQWLSQSLLCE